MSYYLKVNIPRALSLREAISLLLKIDVQKLWFFPQVQDASLETVNNLTEI
jgi:hypothetical protein